MEDAKSKSPWRVGIMPGVTGMVRDKLEPRRLQISKAATLADLAKQYTFYTPALLYMKVRLMGREPYFDYMMEQHVFDIPYCLEFEKPLFRGLENPDPLKRDATWNHVLYCLETREAETYFKWISTLGFTDRPIQRFSRLRYQELEVVDWLAMDKLSSLPEKLPLVGVKGFVIDSNHGCCYFDPLPLTLERPMRAVCTQYAFPDTKAFADALRRGESNPYATVEEDYWSEAAYLKRVADARRTSQA